MASELALISAAASYAFMSGRSSLVSVTDVLR
jgi:hypothetical protein